MNTSTTTTTSGAKAHFLAMVRKAHELGQVFLITHRGEESAVLLGSEDYEGLLETLDILRNNKVAASIMQSLKDLKKGNVYSFEEVTGRKQRK
ncbi:MAG: hypothetical protein CVU78_08025 [Elusimicrobia bacterium HGW-Elusimicrobia-2]|nr:MAG: hypothetical protein CVU78_08025 [Elusimicrobia bacterium HGW-Elusimicrobia-2]